jgi:hypothetical protein
VKEQSEDLDLITEVAGRPQEAIPMTPEQAIRLTKVDLWLGDLFPRMEAEYREMHRLPKKLSQI